MGEDGRFRALETTLNSIQKRYGEGAIMRLGQASHLQVETIPTGYLLIESGTLTSVQYISSSLPIPRSKHDLACAHALAAQYLGMQLVYLEAGSGANGAVPVAMVQAVRAVVHDNATPDEAFDMYETLKNEK